MHLSEHLEQLDIRILKLLLNEEKSHVCYTTEPQRGCIVGD